MKTLKITLIALFALIANLSYAQKLDTLDMLMAYKWKYTPREHVVVYNTYNANIIESQNIFEHDELTFNSLYYLSNEIETVFEQSKVGEIKNGKYIIIFNDKKNNHSVSEIIELNELNLIIKSVPLPDVVIIGGRLPLTFHATDK